MTTGRLHAFSLDEWRYDAACRGKPTSWWYPDNNGLNALTTQLARSICAGCPVREPCEAAAANRDEPGIWGGLSIKERRRRAREGNQRIRHLVCKQCRRGFTIPAEMAGQKLHCSSQCAKTAGRRRAV